MKQRHGQQGAVLATALLLLLVMTLLAMTGMEGSVLNERMVSNWQQRDKTFQVADSSAAQAKANLVHLHNAYTNNTDTLNALDDLDDLPRTVTTDFKKQTMLIGESDSVGWHYESAGTATQTNGINTTVAHGFFYEVPAPSN